MYGQVRTIVRSDSNRVLRWEQSVNILAIVLRSLSGILYLYQGQEVGMLIPPCSWSTVKYRDFMSFSDARNRPADDILSLSCIIHYLLTTDRDAST